MRLSPSYVSRAGKSVAGRVTRRVVNAWKRVLSRVLPYQPMTGGRDRLDDEYRKGAWDYLAGLDEAGRFSVVAGYCAYLHPEGTILDLGCGEGTLAHRLGSHSNPHPSYVGVDISEVAIGRARARGIPNASFASHDVATYEPSGTYNLIIFSECLEYFGDPLSVLRRYEAALRGDGVYIVSMYVGAGTSRTEKIWKMLETRYLVRAASHISNECGLTWDIKVLVR